MEEEISKIMDNELMGNSDDSPRCAEKITEMVIMFIDFLKDECETTLDLSTGKYVFINESAKKLSFTMTTEEIFDYWINIK